MPAKVPMKPEVNRNLLNNLLVGLLIVAAFVIGSLYQKVKFFEGGGQVKQEKQQQVEVQVPTQPAERVDVTVADDDPVLGRKEAKVTLVVFEDFQCPFCGAFSGLNKEMVTRMKERDSSWLAALPNIKKDYVDSGKVRVVWKDYPFLGEESRWAAAAARCAQEQGKFWEYHDYVFSNQSGENQGAFSKDNLKKFATELRLNTAKFNECFDSNKYDQKLSEALTYGQQVGVSGTPASFINGKQISGAASYTTFKAEIEAALK